MKKKEISKNRPQKQDQQQCMKYGPVDTWHILNKILFKKFNVTKSSFT